MFIYGCPTTNHQIKGDAGAHSTCITAPNTFYITSHDTSFHRKKYSPQMIHQLRPRFCQVKIKRELVVKTRHKLCRCVEMSIDTSFSSTTNRGFFPWDHWHLLSVRIAVLVLVWPKHDEPGVRLLVYGVEDQTQSFKYTSHAFYHWTIPPDFLDCNNNSRFVGHNSTMAHI